MVLPSLHKFIVLCKFIIIRSDFQLQITFLHHCPCFTNLKNEDRSPQCLRIFFCFHMLLSTETQDAKPWCVLFLLICLFLQAQPRTRLWVRENSISSPILHRSQACHFMSWPRFLHEKLAFSSCTQKRHRISSGGNSLIAKGARDSVSQTHLPTRANVFHINLFGL